jgi:hypothetical protein
VSFFSAGTPIDKLAYLPIGVVIPVLMQILFTGVVFVKKGRNGVFKDI